MGARSQASAELAQEPQAVGRPRAKRFGRNRYKMVGTLQLLVFCIFRPSGSLGSGAGVLTCNGDGAGGRRVDARVVPCELSTAFLRD